MADIHSWFVGVDWATQKHAVCVVDGQGKRVLEKEFEHSGAGLEALAQKLAELAPGHPKQVAVAIELSRGTIVETLLDRGFSVFGINPKQLDRFRDRYTVAGSKDDRLDAFVLADAVRTDQRLLRQLKVDDPTTIELRETSRSAEDLREESVRLANQLRDLLLRYFPVLLTFAAGADEAWLWALLKKATTPTAASRLSRRALAKLLHENRIRRITVEELQQALASRPVFVAPGVTEALAERVKLLLPRLGLVHEQRVQVHHRLDRLLKQLSAVPEETPPGQKCEHRDAKILLSLPGVGVRVAATMLAEASTALAARDYDTLRALSGLAPVSRKSGKSSQVLQRRACNPHLREAMHHCSRVAAMRDPKAKAHYARLRQAGHGHARALRGVGDRLLRILVGMLKSATVYESNHGEAPTPPVVA